MMKQLLLLFSATLLAAGCHATTEIPHLKVGEMVPAGDVLAIDGTAVPLIDLVEGNPTVLIFYRGGWCPYCSRHLSELAEIVPTLEKEGFQIIAISPDQPSKLRAKPDLGQLPYSLYSDSSMEVSQSFGIAFQVDDDLVDKYLNSYGIDLEGDSGQTHHLLPHPAVFIVDGSGTIRFAHVDANYKKRMDPDEILAAADAVLENPA